MILMVCGPYTHPDEEGRLINTNKATYVGIQLMDAGHTVIIPHLLHYADKSYPRSWQHWMDQTLELIPVLDGIVLIPGWLTSKGSMQEYRKAQIERKRIFFWQITQDRDLLLTSVDKPSKWNTFPGPIGIDITTSTDSDTNTGEWIQSNMAGALE